eukprot:TRINITY_DN276_c0_g1_i2.p1 TRINITY_DN276_c0_g1~~TRINITY_DN276_c0_g1_i2.p1  ORF type:complete len:859 (-),score=169.72 TRINITY_DN276_c0_g1_i2:232-2808(-)
MSGLFVFGSAQFLPLVSVDVEINIVDAIADVCMTQVFTNSEPIELECYYSFPVDPSSSLYSIVVDLPRETIVAKIKEKETARQEYQEAIRSGHSAVLGEEKSTENVVISVGNIEGQSQCTVKVRFVTPLLSDDSNLRFVLPTVISPRYTPHNYVESYTNPTLTQKAAAPFQFNIRTKIETHAKMVQAKCLTYDVETVVEQEGHVVRLSTNTEKQQWKGDYVVTIDLEDPHEPGCCFEILGDYFAFGLSVNPDFVEPNEIIDPSNQDFVFVIDRSGSMQGSRISQVRDTMVLFLRSLPFGCYFNIIGFGSRFESLFPKAVEYDEKNMEKATDFCKSVQADLGGTEILRPLKHIRKEVEKKSRLLNLFILTDGEVSNTSEVLAEAKSMLPSTRVFTFGIGRDVSHELVRGLAKNGRGTAEFVVEGEELDSKVVRSLSQCTKSTLQNVRIDWGIIPAVTSQSESLFLIDGKRTTIYGIGKTAELTGTSGKHSITITGDSNGRKHSIPVTVDRDSKSNLSGSIVRIASSQRIRELESMSGDGSATVEATLLSLATQVLCSKTAFIGVSKSKVVQDSGENLEKPVRVSTVSSLDDEYLPQAQLLSCGLYDMSTASSSAAPSFSKRAMVKKKSAGFPMPSFGSSSRASYASSAPQSSQAPPSSGFFSRVMSSFSSAPRASAASSAPMPTASYSYAPAAAYAPVAACAPAPVQYMKQSALMSAPDEDDSDLCEGFADFSAPPMSSAAGFATPSAPLTAARPPMSPDVKLRRIVELQKAMGYWTLSQEICDVLGMEMAIINSTASQFGAPEHSLITAVVLRFLEIHLGQLRDRWILVANKATAWMGRLEAPMRAQVQEAAIRVCPQ